MNGTKNTQIEVRMTKLWSYEVGQKTGELLQHRDVENPRRDVAETEHPDIMKFPKDVTTFGVCFGWIFSPFEPIIVGFKAQTQGIDEGTI